MTPIRGQAFAIGLGLCFSFASNGAQTPSEPLIPAFSSQSAQAVLPAGWSSVTFRKSEHHTKYSLVREDNALVVRADAHASASALIHRTQIDLRHYPVLRWRWKIDHVLARSDIARKSGDDFPVRVYVTFDIDSQRASMGERMRHRVAQLMFGRELPFSGLCYVWDTHSAIGTITPNAYAANVRMLVLETGAALAGRWVEERRNVLEDYRAAFGYDPPALSGIAIMTDTDDTGESVSAWYGDFVMEAARAQ